MTARLTILAAITGLEPDAAAQAKQRHSSEPILWQDSQESLEEMTALLSEKGLHVVRGGRFVHIMGRIDKADAMLWLLDRYREDRPDITWVSIALGDSPNDRRMLESAEIAVVIPGPDGTHMQITKQGMILRPAQPGPAGWNSAIMDILHHSS